MIRLALCLGVLLLLAQPAWADPAEGMYGVPRGGAPVKSEIPFPVRVGGTGNDSYVTGRCLETWTDGGVIRFRSSSTVCAPGDVPTPTPTVTSTAATVTPTPGGTVYQVGDCLGPVCFKDENNNTGTKFCYRSTSGTKRVCFSAALGVFNRAIAIPDHDGTLAVAVEAPLTLSADGVVRMPTPTPTVTPTPTLSPTPTMTRTPTPTITATPTGSGDITSVGDCLTGACFGASSAQSDCLYFGNDGAGNAITVCPGGAPSTPKTIFWPLAYDGVVVVSCLPPLYCIDGQVFLATPSPTPTPTATGPTATPTPSGADCTGAPTLLCLAARAGAANDPTISSDVDGTITGSAATGKGLVLKPNPLDVSDGVFVEPNASGLTRLRVGMAPDASGVMQFVVTNDTDTAYFGAAAGGTNAPTFLGLKVRNTLAAPAETQAGDTLLVMFASGVDSTGGIALPNAFLMSVDQAGPSGVGYVPSSVSWYTFDTLGSAGLRLAINGDGSVSLPSGAAVGTSSSPTTGDAFTVAGQLGVEGAAVFRGAIPTCGTGCASLSATSNDRDMDITVSAGVVTAVTVNFSATLATAPICVGSTNSAALGGAAVTARSTTAVTFGTTATIGSGHIYAHCFEAS